MQDRGTKDRFLVVVRFWGVVCCWFFFFLMIFILFYVGFILTRIFNLRSRMLSLPKLSSSAETLLVYP